jgi:predicted ArsR family transcriptional regulator
LSIDSFKFFKFFFDIKEVEELTIKQIAQKLELSQTAAKMRLYRLGIKPTIYVGNTGLYEPTVIDQIRESAPPGRPRKKKP